MDGAYMILGDDIVINNDSVAECYKGIMKQLGVEISIPKTHRSKYMYEFAKRWHYRGTEISGIPLNGFLTVGQFY